MPAKKRNEPRFKSFLGRVFTLRNHKVIPASYDNSTGRMQMKPEEIGQAALVLDETNTRVKVCTTNADYVWIPKFYLHKEVKSGNSVFYEVDTISEIIQELLSMAEDIRETANEIECEDGCTDCGEKEKFEVYSEELQRLANSLRQYADKVNPTTPKK
jgi:hypothetical protein